MNPEAVMTNDWIESLAIRALAVVSGLTVMAAAVLNLTPPVSRDALIHHLAIPKLWLQQGVLAEIPWSQFSYFPMNLDLLYMLCLRCGSDTAPKFIHLAFALATALFIYRYLHQRRGRVSAWLGVVVFLTTPLVFRLATSAYVDLGLSFFVTASLLGLLRWRKGRYRSPVHLALAAISLGLAVGTKYNALPAWLLLTLMAIFVHAREIQRQRTALRWGLLFFLLTTLVAAPWFIRNARLTGNPVYPLMGKAFAVFHPTDETVVSKAGAGEKVGFFQLREILYGESFLETLSIPVRIFFQGRDNSYRYFQGVLNPILILFVPFAFRRRADRFEMGFLAAFCLLYTSQVFFLTLQQVRYLMPIIPALSILAAAGIDGLVRWMPKADAGRFGRFVVAVAVMGLLGLNLAYAKNLLASVAPIPYLMGRESRPEFLRRHLRHYAAVEFVNRSLSADAVVYTMFLGRRGYYLERDYRNEHTFGLRTLRKLIAAVEDPAEFGRVTRSLGATHLLARLDLLESTLRVNFEPARIDRLRSLIAHSWRLIYAENGYAVWELNPADSGMSEAPRQPIELPKGEWNVR